MDDLNTALYYIGVYEEELAARQKKRFYCTTEADQIKCDKAIERCKAEMAKYKAMYVRAIATEK